MRSKNLSLQPSGCASRSPRRRQRTLPVRRVRRLLTTGLCAGATLLGGALAAHAQSRGIPAQQAALWGHGGQGACCTPCQPYPQAPHAPYYAPAQPGMAPQPDAAAPEAEIAPSPVAPEAAPSFASLSGATGAPAAPSSATPNMVGDFFGTAQQATVFVFGDSDFGDGGLITMIDPNESVAGRIKQAESYSPIPVDRIFLDYTAYFNVPIGAATGTDRNFIDVQRFTPGFERTFLDSLMSVDVRMPFARTVDSSINFNEGFVDGDDWEAGNLNVAVKTLLFQNNALAFTTGLGIRTPTANDLVVQSDDTTLEIDNRAVHLLPFVGLLSTPNETFFGQAMIQVDVDANGNDVYLNVNDTGPVFQGTIQDQTFLYSSFALGAWLLDNPASDGLASVAGTLEVHYSTAVRDVDTLNNPNELIITEGVIDGNGNIIEDNDFDAVTGVIGLHLFYAGGAQVTFAYGVPLADDEFADGEFRTLLNRYY